MLPQCHSIGITYVIAVIVFGSQKPKNMKNKGGKMSARDLNNRYLKRGVMFINLASYLRELKAIEHSLPDDQRLPVPTLAELARAVGSNRNSMSRISRGDATSINIALAGRIVREMRHRGFPMEVTDLIPYVGPGPRPRERVLAELRESSE